jgi:Protein of unknown function (DUF1203)
MCKLKIVPVDSRMVDQVRRTMKAPVYGFPAHREVTTGRAPCRHCLKLIRPREEELILFTYDAFHGQGVPPMPGPIYLHAQECEAYSGNGEIPAEYRGEPLTFEAFGANRARMAERLVHRSGEDEALQEIFAREEVEYVHARSTSAGCYLFRIERA